MGHAAAIVSITTRTASSQYGYSRQRSRPRHERHCTTRTTTTRAIGSTRNIAFFARTTVRNNRAIPYETIRSDQNNAATLAASNTVRIVINVTTTTAATHD